MWNQRKQSTRERWTQKTFGLTEDDRYLMKAAISFTPLKLEIFWPLLTGAQLIITPPGVEQDSGALVGLLEQHRITVTNFVPSMLRVLLEEQGIEKCTSLRHVICFGEALPAELEDRFFSRMSGDLSVIYGATEAPSATFRKCKRDGPSRSLNIGQRLPSKQLYVLSPSLELVPIGVPGEIYIGGETSTRGYLNRPDLTAERFLPNPFSNIPGARMYRTGDRGRYLADASLEFLGRTDQQLKIRGFRIEPKEIEKTLEKSLTVRQAVVVAQGDARGEQRLVAYVVPRHPTNSSASDLRRFAKQRLPYYMVPSAFVLLESLPLTSNGKIDRKSLPAPNWIGRESEVSYVPPRSPVEELLVATWAGILNREQVGIRDNFFELGGDSLLATRLMSEVRKTFQVEISLRVLFDDPSVEALAIAIYAKLTTAEINDPQFELPPS
jgi:acyl-coenzyme A synthetase/AMP-(fatty) acid ligase/acyl carrier protein